MSITEDELEKIDNSIRSGDYKSARRKLELFNIKSVPERLALKVSNLLVRAGMPKKSAKVLFPLMYQNQGGAPQNPNVAALYAFSLHQLGAYNEAFKIYQKLDFNLVPSANFYYSIALFSKWEYEQAIPYLEKFLSSKEVMPYQRLVASTNLAQAYIAATRFDEATELLNNIKAESEKHNYTLLLANCLELNAQLFFGKKEFKRALQLLDISKKMLVSFPSHYQLMVEYWQVICELTQNPQQNKYLKALQELRLKAVQKGFWSVVRECDFHRAVIEKDENLFLKVYFGTPFSSYREKLKSKFPSTSLPQTYNWNPAPSPAAEGHVFKLSEGHDLVSGEKLKKGHVSHRVFQTLASDFYVPFRAETIFSYAFANELYNPITSYKRSANAVMRLQAWFDENKIPLKIRLKENAYRIYFVQPYMIEVPLQSEDSNKFDNQTEIEKLLESSDSLTSQQVADRLQIPKRTVNRRLKDLLDAGKIVLDEWKRYRKA